MKTKIVIISLFLMLGIGTSILPQQAYAQGGYVSFQVFYDDLSPYGNWVFNPDYGYVWVPNVDPGFTPYSTNGYWIFTDEGWTWVSNYPWGWAPFHYGRWFNDPNYGYMWVPDNEWGPGWVTWRRSSDYYGWAPIGPGVSISIAYSNGYNLPYDNWTFVRNRDFGRRDIHNYYMRPSNNVTIINNSTVIINNHVDNARHVTYNAGPDRREVEKHAGQTFTPVAIKESSRPGEKVSSRELQIYRPQVQKNAPDGHKPAPSNVKSLDQIKPTGIRTQGPPSEKGTPAVKQQPQKPPQQSLPDKKQQPPREQPQKQQPPQQQPPQQQPPKQQPPREQPPQQQPQKQQPQHNPQPVKQQPQQAPKDNPPQKKGDEQPPH